MSSFLFTDCARTPARILVVDDERPFRESLAELLRDDGHDVLEYSRPADVPRLDALDGIGLLLTDYEMPGKNGLTFADEFHAHHPGTPVLLMTAYPLGLDAELARRPFVRLIVKPIGYDALHRVVHEWAATIRPVTDGG
jgi:DNA-binding NtrC family response regulator